jgi:stage II sporulation protein AA (anti-sigma F factor antagonist)
MPQPGLSLTARADGRRHVITLSGELDLATAEVLESSVAEACSDGARELLLDLEQLRFMDSTGLRAVLMARERCEGDGCELYLARPQRAVRQLLELTGVLPRLRLIELDD